MNKDKPYRAKVVTPAALYVGPLLIAFWVSSYFLATAPAPVLYLLIGLVVTLWGLYVRMQRVRDANAANLELAVLQAQAADDE